MIENKVTPSMDLIYRLKSLEISSFASNNQLLQKYLKFLGQQIRKRVIKLWVPGILQCNVPYLPE